MDGRTDSLGTVWGGGRLNEETPNLTPWGLSTPNPTSKPLEVLSLWGRKTSRPGRDRPSLYRYLG